MYHAKVWKIETEVSIKQQDLPVQVLKYIEPNFKGKILTEYAKITKYDGYVVFVIKIKRKDYNSQINNLN